MSKRIAFLGFAMTCVIVVYHCGATGATAAGGIDAWADSLVSGTCDQLAVIAMSHFFAVTGFLLFRGLTLESFPKKLKRRTLTLLVPYLIWQVFFFFFNYLFVGRAFSIGKFVRTVFLFQAWPPDGALWYLYAVYALALISPLLLVVCRSRRVAGAFVVAMCFACYWAAYVDEGAVNQLISYGYVGNIVLYLPSYLLGVYYGFFQDRENKPRFGLCAVIALAAIVLSFAGGELEGVLSFTAIRMLPIGLLHLLPMALIPEKGGLFKLSFLMYVIHQPFISLVVPPLQMLVVGLVPGLALPNLLVRAVYLVLVVLAAWLLTLALRKVSPKALNLLTGGRN